MISKRLTIICLALFVSINYAQSSEILKDLQNKFESIEDFSAKFTQKISSASQTNASGKIFYMKPDKYRVEIAGQVITTDGDLIYNYNKNQKKVLINDAVETPQTFSFDNFIYIYPSHSEIIELESKIVDGETLNGLRLKPKSGYLPYNDLVIWANNEKLIKQVEITMQSGKILFELDDIKINQNLDSKLFNFNIPEGTQVIDLR